MIDRKKLKRLLLTIKAKTSGVLVAMPSTIQGLSGWYMAPNGNDIFYFVHDEFVSTFFAFILVF